MLQFSYVYNKQIFSHRTHYMLLYNKATYTGHVHQLDEEQVQIYRRVYHCKKRDQTINIEHSGLPE